VLDHRATTYNHPPAGPAPRVLEDASAIEVSGGPRRGACHAAYHRGQLRASIHVRATNSAGLIVLDTACDKGMQDYYALRHDAKTSLSATA
jgi:hypothetical protein